MHAVSMHPAPEASSKPAIPPDVAIALLKALSSDDAFRQLFKSDPRSALSEVGFKLPVGAATPMCMMVGELASKEEILDAYDALYSHLTGATRASMTVIFTFAHGHGSEAANSAE
ncbi:NHLP-related RiPP peptide [Stenotrophomonas sp. ISL-67]|uniref:NHLP-related RiPP peptide n=1 Tax=Stenotrophomonas sp. ISL-67 TaxID=2819171 RepID=UPI001BEB442D|nr:NHLP-related RiPP peptide [Stenotrophomonas sp. ISL-67]MBT2767692.1 NHLP-related RiPP peptide [Stenotrophomonas sp. ISL-67]